MYNIEYSQGNSGYYTKVRENEKTYGLSCYFLLFFCHRFVLCICARACVYACVRVSSFFVFVSRRIDRSFAFLDRSIPFSVSFARSSCSRFQGKRESVFWLWLSCRLVNNRRSSVSFLGEIRDFSKVKIKCSRDTRYAFRSCGVYGVCP